MAVKSFLVHFLLASVFFQEVQDLIIFSEIASHLIKVLGCGSEGSQ